MRQVVPSSTMKITVIGKNHVLTLNVFHFYSEQQQKEQHSGEHFMLHSPQGC